MIATRLAPSSAVTATVAAEMVQVDTMPQSGVAPFIDSCFISNCRFFCDAIAPIRIHCAQFSQIFTALWSRWSEYSFI